MTINPTPLYYDTFQALQSDASLPLAASLDLLIRSITCSLIKIRTIISSQHDPSAPEIADLGHHDGDAYLMLPREATAETISRFLRILRQFEKSVLNPIASLKTLCDVHEKHTNLILASSRSRKLHAKSLAWRNTQVEKLVCRLSKNLNRIRSQVESLVYWTDNMLLASLANSAREERTSKPSFTAEEHVRSDESFNVLIDSCVDITEAGWSMITQLAQADTLLATPPAVRLAQPSRPVPSSSSLGHSRRNLSSHSSSKSVDPRRRLHRRSIKKIRPSIAVDFKGLIERVMVSLDPHRSLTSIRLVEHLLRVIE